MEGDEKLYEDSKGVQGIEDVVSSDEDGVWVMILGIGLDID